MEVDHATLLKRDLIQLPYEYQFHFSDVVRTRIRRMIMLALANGTEDLQYYFPRLFDNPGHQQNEPVISTLDGLQWSYQMYHTDIPHQRDPKYNNLVHLINHYHRPCGKLFNKGEAVYRCLTCAHDESVALCHDCFSHQVHRSHRLHIYITQVDRSGVCDCGDPEAWNDSNPCGHYENKAVTSLPEILPKPLVDRFATVLRILLDYCIDVLAYLDQHLLGETTNEAAIKLHSMQLTLDLYLYGFPGEEVVDINLDKYALVLYNDQIHLYRDAILRIRLALRKQVQFATMVTDRVETYGRAKVAELTDIAVLQQRQMVLGATGLSTCIRSVRDIFREDMVDEIIFWLDSFQNLEIFKLSTELQDLFCQIFCERWQPGLMVFPGPRPDCTGYVPGSLDGDLTIPKVPSTVTSLSPEWEYSPKLWDLEAGLCAQCDYNLNTDDYVPNRGHRGLRFQYIVYFDTRLWKLARKKFSRVLDQSLVTNLRYRLMVGAQYLDIHTVVADLIMKLDREPELNIMQVLSTQLLTCNTNVQLIFHHGEFTQLMAVVYGFLTTDAVLNANSVSTTNEVSMKLLKNPKLSKLVFDVNFMLGKGFYGEEVLTEKPVRMMLDMLALTQGKPVLKREHEVHVEYESPDYNALFNALIMLYKGMDLMVNCAAGIKDPVRRYRQICSAISQTVHFLFLMECGGIQGFNPDITDINANPPLLVEPVLGATIANITLSEDKVALLHPVHSFLIALILVAKFTCIQAFEEIVLDTVEKMPPAKTNPLATIFDYPIRAMALMSQIKLGFWVRNGYTVRNQLQIYKLLQLRDWGFLSDLFLIQIFINIADPNLLIFLILHRFQLLPQMANHGEAVYDRKTLPYILEECINLFLQVLSENPEGQDSRIRKDLIHSLCFGSMSLSKCRQLLLDHISNHKRFWSHLVSLAHFTPPVGATDVGIFTLKPENLDEVNPFYFSYSANTRDDAIKLVKSRRAKQLNCKVEEVVIDPVILEPSLCFNKNYRFALSEYFPQFISYAISHSMSADVSDGVMTTVLHLVHAVVKAVPAEVVLPDQSSMVAQLCLLLDLDEASQHHAKVRAIFAVLNSKWPNMTTKLVQQVPEFDVLLLTSHKLGGSTPVDDQVRKKQLAKIRQEKLMAKFKQQQKNFLENFDGGDVDMDELVSDESEDDPGWRFPEPHCILCQNATEDAGPFGVITYILRSSEFRRVPFDDPFWFMEAYSDHADLDKAEPMVVPTSVLEADYLPEGETSEAKTERWRAYRTAVNANYVFGPGFDHPESVDLNLVLLSCGHGMHYQCYMNYLATNRSRQNQITRNYPENPDRKEFLCPLCKAINNLFYPILWANNNFSLLKMLLPNDEDVVGELSPLVLRELPAWFELLAVALHHKTKERALLTAQATSVCALHDEKQPMLTQQSQFWHLMVNMFNSFAFTCFPEVVKLDLVLILTNTIKSMEIALRGVSSDGRTVADQVSPINMTNLRVLHQFRMTGLMMKLTNTVQNQLRLEATMSIFSSYLKLSNEGIVKLVIEADFFKLLLECIAIDEIGISANVLLSRCLFGVVIQSVMGLAHNLVKQDFYMSTGDFSVLDVPMVENIPVGGGSWARAVFCRVAGMEDHPVVADPTFGNAMYSLIIKLVTPFLRQAVIYYGVQCAQTDITVSNTSCEADRLCEYLRVSLVRDILQLVTGNHWLAEVFQELVYKQTLELAKIPRALEYPGIVRLIKLPQRLDMFFTRYFFLDRFGYPCDQFESPAVCMVCGEVMEVQQKTPGSREGQCTNHMLRECSSETGMFWLPQERMILLLHDNGGSFDNAPYLDSLGEPFTDHSNRGITMYLMPPRYQDFMKNVWLQHKVPNIIVRSLDLVLDAGGWDTL